MRTLWGEVIDVEDENRESMRSNEKRAAVRINQLRFPPLCPTCLKTNPHSVHLLRVREGHRAGLVRPIYVPHCRACSITSRLNRANLGWLLLVVVGVGILVYLLLHYFYLKDYRMDVEGTRLADFLKNPLSWISVVVVGVMTYLIQRRGIVIAAINESAIIFSFKQQEYCDRFRELHRIGVRKRAAELEDWEAVYCPHCNRPAGKGRENCLYCGRSLAPAPAASGAPAEAGAAVREAVEGPQAVPERTTTGGVAVTSWPKVIYCECGRKYRFNKPGTYQCVDPRCGKIFIMD